jgi:NADP-dependent 3-hydroxy acid dehydrogenase YdfG
VYFASRLRPLSLHMDADTFTSNNLFSIRGRNALITGATSGIGFMMAQGLIVNGVQTLFITGHDLDINEKVLILQNLATERKVNCMVLGCVF